MRPHPIAILTDTTCDIPQPLQEQYSLFVVPHVIIWGEHQYRDRVDLQPEEFYRRLPVEKVMPTTSQATVQDFAKVYQRAVDSGAQHILAMIVSSGLSGAIQSATQAASEAPVPVTIFDSRGVSMSLGWQVLAAARARQAGGGLEEMVAAAEKVRERMHLLILLNSLEYVYRGGRIGNARRLIGAALNIKPLIYIDHATGVVEPGGISMTRRKGLETLYQKFFSQLGSGPSKRVAVLHGDAAKDAADLYARVEAEHHPVEMVMNMPTPTLGTHTGPQTIALCGYAEE